MFTLIKLRKNVHNFSLEHHFLFVAAVWGIWSSWSGCTSSCGGGRRSRVRSCLNGNTCHGPTHEYENCNELFCPDCKFKNWFMKHSLIYNFIYLLFLYFGLLLFLSLSLPPSLPFSLIIAPTWNSWSSWSECSQTCQTGFRYRIRYCQNGQNADCPGNSQEEESCNSDITCGEMYLNTESEYHVSKSIPSINPFLK